MTAKKNSAASVQKIITPVSETVAENVVENIVAEVQGAALPAEKKVQPKRVRTAKPVVVPEAIVVAAEGAAIPAPKKAAIKKLKKVSKVVRDSFTMPLKEYQKIAQLKESCLKAGFPVKKSEVLRAGLNALCEMNAVQLQQAMAGLDKIKTGRPQLAQDKKTRAKRIKIEQQF